MRARLVRTASGTSTSERSHSTSAPTPDSSTAPDRAAIDDTANSATASCGSRVCRWARSTRGHCQKASILAHTNPTVPWVARRSSRMRRSSSPTDDDGSTTSTATPIADEMCCCAAPSASTTWRSGASDRQASTSELTPTPGVPVTRTDVPAAMVVASNPVRSATRARRSSASAAVIGHPPPAGRRARPRPHRGRSRSSRRVRSSPATASGVDDEPARPSPAAVRRDRRSRWRRAGTR